MQHQISNDILSVSIQDKGAEICSIVSKKTGIEYMWNASPEIWGSFAPVLFPIIGSLKDKSFIFTNKIYSVPKHGFIRNNENLLVQVLDDRTVEYRLKYDDESLKYYPFKFEIIIQFKVSDNKLIVKHEIINHDQVNPIYFSLGGHPAFKCPFNTNEDYSDYHIEFEQSETVDKWNVLENGLIDVTTTPFLNDSNLIELSHELFEKDAIVLKDLKSKSLSLKTKKSSNYIQLEYSDFPYLGIWAKPNGDFVCIEPWQGISDSIDSNQLFSKKEGIVKLKQKSTYHAKFIISIHED